MKFDSRGGSYTLFVIVFFVLIAVSLTIGFLYDFPTPSIIATVIASAGAVIVLTVMLIDYYSKKHK